MPSVTIRIGNNQHTDANFSWWEVWGSQTNHAIGDVIANAEWDSWFAGRYEFHTGVSAGQTWYYWARAAYDKGATVTGLVSLGSVTVAATGENMPAWTLKGRNAGTTGTPHNIDFNDLTEEAAPTTGDKLVGWLNSGELRMFDVGNLPGGSGSSSGGVSAMTQKRQVSADLICVNPPFPLSLWPIHLARARFPRSLFDTPPVSTDSYWLV